MNKDKNIQLITVFGAGLIGAGIGMLLASEKGTTTRKRLKDGLNNGIYKLKNSIEVAAENLRDKFNSEKNDIEGTYDDLQPNMTYKTEELILFL